MLRDIACASQTATMEATSLSHCSLSLVHARIPASAGLAALGRMLFRL
jgi:hypothetical protein